MNIDHSSTVHTTHSIFPHACFYCNIQCREPILITLSTLTPLEYSIMPKTPKHERGPRIPDGPQLSIPTDSQRPIKSCLSKLFSKPKLKREPYYRLETSSAAPEHCSEDLEQELSDFVKDAIRINSSPASPHSPSHVTPNTSLDQQTRGDALNESEMSYNLGIPSKKGGKFRTWGGVWTR